MGWWWHFCFGYQIFESNLDAHAYYCVVVWSEWNNQVVHGCKTLTFVGKVWFVPLNICICYGWGNLMWQLWQLIANLWRFIGFMKVHGLGIWCLKPINMLQMMRKFLLGDYKCECERRLGWFNYRKPLLGLKCLRKGGKSGNIFNL